MTLSGLLQRFAFSLPLAALLVMAQLLSPAAVRAENSENVDLNELAQRLNGAQLNQRLQQLIEQRSYHQALNLARDYLHEFEGEAVFDFHYGFAAAQSGRYNEAVFAFERLSQAYPEVPRYQLELARCYFHLQQHDAAEVQFNKVLAQSPPAEVEKTIRRFLNIISERRRRLLPKWSGQVSYSGGYDSNINSATSADRISVDLPTFEDPVQYTPEEAISAGFYQLRAALSYQTPLTQRSGFTGNIGAQRKHNSKTNQYDIDALYAEGNLQLNRGRHQWRVGGRYQHYWLARRDLQYQVSTNGRYSYALGSQTEGFLTLELQDTQNRQNPDLDALQYQLSVGTSQILPRFQWQLQAQAAVDNAASSPLARNTLGLSFSSQWLWKPDQQFYSLLAWRDYKFQRVDEQNLLTDGRKREESLSQLVLGYNRTLTSYLRAYTQLSYQDKRSNAEVYQFHRTLLEVGLSAYF